MDGPLAWPARDALGAMAPRLNAPEILAARAEDIDEKWLDEKVFVMCLVPCYKIVA